MATSSWSSFLTKVWRLSLQMVPYTFMNDLWPNMMKIYMREACIWLLSGYDHWHCHYHNHRHFILPPKWISQKWWYFCLLFHLISMIFFSFLCPHLFPCDNEYWMSASPVKQKCDNQDRRETKIPPECFYREEFGSVSQPANFLKNQQRRLVAWTSAPRQLQKHLPIFTAPLVDCPTRGSLLFVFAFVSWLN